MDEPIQAPEKGIVTVPGGGETKQNVSAWEVDTLHTHFNALLSEIDRRYQQRFEAQETRYAHEFQAQDQGVSERFVANEKMVREVAILQERALTAAMVAQEKAVAAALQAAERAVSKQEQSSEKRFDSVNEFRAQLSDQAATFLTRSESIQRMDTINEKISALEKRMDRDDGKGEGLSSGWGFVLGAIGCIGGVVGIVSAIIAFTR